MTEEIDASRFETDKILVSDIERAPWPYETCGCRVPEDALPPKWTCLKCGSSVYYLGGSIQSWVRGA